MLHYPERPATQSDKLLDTFRSTFRSRQESLKRGLAPIRVPQPKRLYERQSQMAYHFKPELFVQTGGATLFRCPEEELLVRAPEICVMPMGVPHHETVENLDTPFENVVVCFYSKTVTVHLARADESMTPRATDIFFYQTPYFSDLVSMLNLAANLHHSSLPDSKLGLQGVMLGVFSLLLNMIATENGAANVESQRVYQCQWLIRNHLQDPELSVQWLADSLGCSSNYLSKLFHDELGERVTQYIMRIRLENALIYQCLPVVLGSLLETLPENAVSYSVAVEFSVSSPRILERYRFSLFSHVFPFLRRFVQSCPIAGITGQSES